MVAKTIVVWYPNKYVNITRDCYYVRHCLFAIYGGIYQLNGLLIDN